MLKKLKEKEKKNIKPVYSTTTIDLLRLQSASSYFQSLEKTTHIPFDSTQLVETFTGLIKLLQSLAVTQGIGNKETVNNKKNTADLSLLHTVYYNHY